MTIILFGVFIALLLLGVPVAFSICSAAAVTMFTGYGDAKMRSSSSACLQAVTLSA